MDKRFIVALAGLSLAGCSTVPPPPEETAPATVVAAPTDAEINATFEKIGASYIDIYTALNPVAATGLSAV